MHVAPFDRLTWLAFILVWVLHTILPNVAAANKTNKIYHREERERATRSQSSSTLSAGDISSRHQSFTSPVSDLKPAFVTISSSTIPDGRGRRPSSKSSRQHSSSPIRSTTTYGLSSPSLSSDPAYTSKKLPSGSSSLAPAYYTGPGHASSLTDKWSTALDRSNTAGTSSSLTFSVATISITTFITEPSTTLTEASLLSTTVPFSITPSLNSPEATSSVRSLQDKISATLVPILQKLVNDPEKSQANRALNEIKKIEPTVKSFLNKHHSGSGSSAGSDSSSCSSHANILSDLLSAASCIEDSLTKAESQVEKGIDNRFSNIDDIKDAISDIADLTDNSKDPDDDSSSSLSSSDESTSCTSTTTSEDVYVKCSTASVSDQKREVASSCQTSTRTVTGCNISAFTTSTTAACSATETVTNCDVLCPTSIAASLKNAAERPSGSCTTICTTGTGCSTKGATTTSWSTTVSSSDGPLPCGSNCASCLSTPRVTSASRRNSETLSKRTLRRLPGEASEDQRVKFMVEEYKKAEILLPNDVDDTGRFIPSSHFEPLESSAVSISLEGLHGCVAVAILSTKGIYMAHFWEVPGLQQEQAEWQPSSPQTFHRDVLGPLEHGLDYIQEEGSLHYDGLAQYAGENNAFARGNNVKAFIVRPMDLVAQYSDWPNSAYDDSYTARVNQIVGKVNAILGFDVNPTIKTYVRNRVASNSADSVLGKILFQYDPDQTRAELASGCTRQETLQRFAVAESFVYDYSWTAYQNQQVDQNNNQKRACPAKETPGASFAVSLAYNSTIDLIPSSATSSTTSSTSSTSTSVSMTSTATTEPSSTTETTHTSTKTTTTTTSSTPSPTAQIIIAYFTEGFSSEWAVYASDIGDTPDWCDGSHGLWKASDHISLDNVPYPDGHHKFDFKIDKMSKCSYSGSSDGAGKLSCPEFSSDVECSKYAHQKETICYAVADAMMVYPKVVCQWA